MEKKSMNVAISLNQKFFYYAYVMLTSLYMNNPESEVVVYILHSELTEEQLQAYQKLAQQYGGEIRPVFIERERFSEQLTTTAEWSIESYYRLTLPDVLPEQVDRVLYLDVDVIVNSSIREFYDMDFEDKMFGVCKEDAANDPERSPELRNKIFADLFKKGFLYFNSGVMLWNLKEVRKRYNFTDYMDIARKFDFTFLTPDQDILNYCHWNEVKYVKTDVYNQFSRVAHNEGKDYTYVKDHVRIIHFAGAKPWNADNIHFDIEQIWWDYAKKTPYFGQLCEAFVYKTINDPFVENYAKELLDSLNTVQSNLSESLALNERLLLLLNQK